MPRPRRFLSYVGHAVVCLVEMVWDLSAYLIFPADW